MSFEGVTFEGGYCIKEDDELTRAILRDQGFEEHELPEEPKFFRYTKPGRPPVSA